MTKASAPREPGQSVGHGGVGGLGPSVHRQATAAVIESDRHRHDRDGAIDQLGVGHGGRTHHDPGHAGVGQRPCVVESAHATTGLHSRPACDGGGDRGHHGSVERVARAGGVEVDHVDPRGAGIGEPDRDGHGSSP